MASSPPWVWPTKNNIYNLNKLSGDVLNVERCAQIDRRNEVTNRPIDQIHFSKDAAPDDV
jgi:hypothetical protein